MTEMQAHHDGGGNIHLLFMEEIQRQTLGCGSGTGVTTYSPEDAPRMAEDYLPVGSVSNGSLLISAQVMQRETCGEA